MPNTRAGFSVFVSDAEDGGYACNETSELSEADLAPAEGAYEGVAPGDTIEVHWVHTTCAATPGEGLGACVPETCTDPLLRVEAQVFLVVNDPDALDFTTMAYGGNTVDDPAPGDDDSGNDRRAGAVSRLHNRSVLRPEHVFAGPGHLERAPAVRQAGYQLAAPLGRAGQRVQ